MRDVEIYFYTISKRGCIVRSTFGCGFELNLLPRDTKTSRDEQTWQQASDKRSNAVDLTIIPQDFFAVARIGLAWKKGVDKILQLLFSDAGLGRDINGPDLTTKKRYSLNQKEVSAWKKNQPQHP